MNEDRKLIFYHSPHSRSGGTLFLLEEIGVPYELHVLDMNANEQRQPPYLSINPMGKVPAIKHGDALVTEQVAIFIYLADYFPASNLAPSISDPLRGSYLRWLVYYAACFEPAVTDRALKRDPAPQRMCPYGDFDTTLSTLTGQLAKGPYILGDRFSAADILWGPALSWITSFKLVPESPEVSAYIARVNARPAAIRAREKDADIITAQAALKG